MIEIIDFCAKCGELLPYIADLDVNVDGVAVCPNCDAPVAQRDQRIQGTFDGKEAERLRDAWFG